MSMTRRASMLAMLCLTTTLSFTSGFVPLAQQPQHQRITPGKQINPVNKIKMPHRSPTPSSTSLFVFDRMSEGCIGAIITAQKEAQNYGQTMVTGDFLLAGVVDMPESSAVERLLKQYGLTWRKTQASLNELYANDPRKSGGLGGFFQARNPDDDLPFGPDVQAALKRAGDVADLFDSKAILVPHVVLGMLEYKPGLAGDGGDASATTDPEKNRSWKVITNVEGFDASHTTALDICKSLISHLSDSKEKEDEKRDLVTGLGGGEQKTKTLDECGIDLTQQAKDGLLDPVQGRDKEIMSCLRTLVRRRKNNVALIGEPGTGKTSIAEGLAQVLIDPEACPPRLSGHRLVSLDLATLVAGTKYRGEFEERLQAIIQEVTAPKATPTILFIDEIHNLVGAGAAEGGMDAANLLKPALARGQFQLVGATTISEYRKYIEKDAALERRLQPVMVSEPSVEATVDILRAIQKSYEDHHGVRYTDEGLIAAAKLSERYITDRFLPDKAIDLMDEAGAIAHLERSMSDMKNGVVKEVSDAGPMRVQDEEDMPDDSDRPVVDEHTVATVISEWAAIPLGKLESGEMDRLVKLEDDMSDRVKGQERAIRSVSRAVRRARSGLRDPGRPIASFLFCGPTGTGKTELCKTLAETYFGSEKDMVRIDMSEYMEKHSVARLTGPPPGYIGYEEGGQLTEAVRRAPHSIVLLDEIEKAHGDVLNILLQIMEDGILTDGKGRTVNFKNAILVMTSNVGSKRIMDMSKYHESIKSDFINSDEDETESNDALYAMLSETVKEELESAMKPELLNRIDEIVVFSPLSSGDLSNIAGLILQKTVNRAQVEREMELSVSDALLEQVRDEGSRNAAQFGARPMRRAAQRFFEDAISDAIVRGFLEAGDSAQVDIAPETENSDPNFFTVMVRRGRDGVEMEIPVERVSGGIGSSTAPTMVNGNGDTANTLSPEAVS